MKVIKTPGRKAGKSSTSYNTKRNTVVVRKPTQMDQRAQEGKYAMLLYSRTPPEEASIHTAAMKEIKEREEIRWVIYTDSLSSMLAIENNRENHPILNQIYEILTEL